MSTTADLNRKLSFGTKVGFGVGSITACVYFAFVSTYGMYFFTDIVGIAPALAGLIFAIGVVWDAVSDPLIGSFSDNLKSPYGRRRPILLAAAVPFIIICWLFATPFEIPGAFKVVYFTVLLLAYYVTVTMSDVPYSALGAEMTSDYDERISLNTFRSFFGQIGIAVSSIFTLVLIDKFTAIFSSEKLGWSLTGLLFGLIGGVAMLICWRATRGKETYVVAEDAKMHRSPVAVWKEVFKNRTFRWTALIFAVATCQMTVYAAFSTYYFIDVIGLTEGQIAFTWTLFSIAQFASMPVTDFLAKKTSKVTAWIIINGACAVIIGVFYLFIIKPGTFIPLYIATCALGFATNTIWQVIWAMIPDCVEVDELVTGKRNEGIYYSITSFVQKVSNALILALGGVFLTLIKYDAMAEVQSSGTLIGLKLIIGIGVPLISVFTILAALKYPLTRKKYEMVIEAIELKRNGKEYDRALLETLY